MRDTAESVIRSHLSAGERLLWCGQPKGGIRFRLGDAFVIPFSLLWCGFALFWEYSVLKIPSNAGPVAIIFPLFGIPFVLVGLYMVIGRFFFDARMRANTFYGLTNERIIIIRGVFSRSTTSKNLESLGETSLSERPDGSGTITFGGGAMGVPFWSAHMPGGMPMGNARHLMPPSFEMIERARTVYEAVRTAQKDLNKA